MFLIIYTIICFDFDVAKVVRFLSQGYNTCYIYNQKSFIETFLFNNERLLL